VGMLALAPRTVHLSSCRDSSPAATLEFALLKRHEWLAADCLQSTSRHIVVHQVDAQRTHRPSLRESQQQRLVR
jgi:hypothetical protein